MKTLRNSSLITLVIVALALLVAAPVAYADSETFTATITPNPTNFSGVTTTLPQFDPSLGTLTSVTVTLNGNGVTDITATETADIATTVSTLLTNVGLTLTDVSVGLNLSESMTGQPLVGGNPISITNPLLIAALGHYDSGSLALMGTQTDQVFGGLSGFIGLGDLTFDLAGNALTTQSFSGGNLNTTQATSAGGGVTITYDYDTGNVPEPGTLSLFGTGLLGLAGMLRSRFGKAR
jgi:hypothetical protein